MLPRAQVQAGRIERADRSVEQLPRAAFCRCGNSKNKPFCDGSHVARRIPRMSDVEFAVVDNPERHRFEARVDGTVAGEIVYRERPDGGLVLLHTEVDESLEGKGIGSRLAAGALDDIRARGLTIVPLCPFVSAYLERHPEYADLVAPER